MWPRQCSRAMPAAWQSAHQSLLFHAPRHIFALLNDKTPSRTGQQHGGKMAAKRESSRAATSNQVSFSAWLCGIAWSGGRDSNPRQPAWEAGTLPTELPPRSQASIRLRNRPVYSITRRSSSRVDEFSRQSLYFFEVQARGRSSAGRALQSHCRGRGFEPPRLHPSNGSNDLTAGGQVVLFP